jgi:Rrf2 family iron-sulfur cluster assembly transcriptional regulator
MRLFSNTNILRVAAIIEIARSEAPLSAGAISKIQGLNHSRAHEMFLQACVEAGIIKGIRGPRGGYRLACKPDLISLGAIMTIIEGMSEAESEPLLVDNLSNRFAERAAKEATSWLASKLQTMTLDSLAKGF